MVAIINRMTLKEKMKAYYYLTKPGIIRGNLIVASAGFFLASNGKVAWSNYAYMLFGMSLIIACGCVLNNYIDRGIDKKMSRTKNRALVTGAITSSNALIFAATLGVIGTVVLIQVNYITLWLGLFGLFAYVVLYAVAKRKTPYGTIIGSISGAVPPLAGYAAVTGSIDLEALLLFAVLVFWQMPHFYAIAIFRKADYAAATLPVMPLVQSSLTVQRRIIGYILGFAVAVLLFHFLGFAGWIYTVVMSALSLRWLYLASKSHTEKEEIRWARGLFGFSLVTLLVWSLLLSVNWLLP